MYVNPEEYYAMEAKIQTQESQIIECEGALKCRNEEVKSLKFERDDLQERYDETELNLQSTKDSLDEVSMELEQTKVCYFIVIQNDTIINAVTVVFLSHLLILSLLIFLSCVIIVISIIIIVIVMPLIIFNNFSLALIHSD